MDLFTLHSLDTDLWYMNFSDTDLDWLDTDIPSKHFFCLQSVLKKSSRHVFKTPSRHVLKCLQDVFSVAMFCLQWVLQDFLKKVLQNISETFWETKNYYAEELLFVEDVFKTCLEDVFKKAWSPANACWEKNNSKYLV